MKLQACKFQRESVVKKLRDKGCKLKSEFADTWETGVAFVKDFNSDDVIYIIDESGNKIPQKEMHTWTLSGNLGFAAIDTDLIYK